MGAGTRATHPSDSRTWPRPTRRTMVGFADPFFNVAIRRRG
jgi:hypothetical protein